MCGITIVFATSNMFPKPDQKTEGVNKVNECTARTNDELEGCFLDGT